MVRARRAGKQPAAAAFCLPLRSCTVSKIIEMLAALALRGIGEFGGRKMRSLSAPAPDNRENAKF